MKLNLLTKTILSAALITTISACDTREDLQTYPDDLKPVEIDGALDYALEFNENDLQFSWDMTTGVTNPEDTQIYPREFTYYRVRLNSDGTPWTDPETGEQEELFVGPPLPQGSVIKSQDVVTLTPDLWAVSLVHPYTAEQRQQEISAAEAWNAANPDNMVAVPPELFSQGTYRFSYLLDNGSETIVERNFVVTVNGVEDVVEEIILGSDYYKAPVGYPVNISSAIMPSNATYQELTWTSSNTDYATVDANGNVLAHEAGIGMTVTITATSSDLGAASVSATAEVDIIAEPLDPVAVDLYLGDTKINKSTVNVSVGESEQISYVLVPGELDFNNTVTWESSDPSAVSVDDMGVISTHILHAEATITATSPGLETDVINTQTFVVKVVENKNLLFNHNPGFESGALDAWTVKGDNAAIIEVSQDAAKDGMYGLSIDTRGGGKGTMITDIDLMRQVSPISASSIYRISFDYKNVTGTGPWKGGFVQLMNNTPSWVTAGQKWFGNGSQDWIHQELEYTGQDLINKSINPGTLQLDISLQGAGESLFYFDNFSVEIIEP
ncbi:Ig-like domain-containing protein [Thalassotalea agariperforans]